MDRSRLSRFVDQQLSNLPLEEPVAVSPQDPVSRALELMREGSRSCVVTIDAGQLTGIFTERDLLTRCMDEGFDWSQPVGGVCTASPRTVASSATVGEAIAILQQHSYRTLPVVDGARVTGLIRTGDLLRHLAEEFPEDVLNLPPRPHQVMEKQEGG
ncbi:MAG: CBS domain-containing protein [Dehalococcoidia bacterium]|nr:CBS domain-containing protein [Dehalococcoidia bacterium]